MRLKPYHLSIILLILFAFFNYTGTFSTMEYSLEDRLYQKRSPVDTRIVIIGIDDSSLGRLGKWPWPRDYHAELISTLSQGQPAVIGIDLILTEASKSPEEDWALIEAVKKAGNIIIPVYGVLGKVAIDGKIMVEELQVPFEGLKGKAAGHINTIPDSDGIVRKTILSLETQDQEVNSFAWEIYQEYLSQQEEANLNISQLPLDQLNRMNIAFTGEPEDYEFIPYHMVLEGEIPSEYFENRIVLVGPYTVGIHDYYFTPLAREVPMQGIEIHANIIQNFLNGDFKSEVTFPFAFSILIVVSLSSMVASNRLKPGKALIAIVLIIIIYIALASLVYNNGVIIPLFYPIVLITLNYLISLAYHYLGEMLERKRVTGVFGRYVAPQVVEKILKEGEAGLQLGGSRREISVLFVDIRGFTPLSESVHPEEVVEILNDYLTLCAKSIFSVGGTLDKFIGDATMAIFNAPLDLEDHEFKAVQAAWAMKRGSEQLEKRLLERFGRAVKFGIGINRGGAVVGNIGADFRMDYTAIGDTVNTAARLESNAKPGQILLSSAVYKKIQERVMVTHLGEINVKGKSQGIEIYQLDGIIANEE